MFKRKTNTDDTLVVALDVYRLYTEILRKKDGYFSASKSNICACSCSGLIQNSEHKIRIPKGQVAKCNLN